MHNVCFLSLFNVICYHAISVTLITVYLLFKFYFIFVQWKSNIRFEALHGGNRYRLGLR